MAMPKTTETSCRDGSAQARHVIHKYPHPYIIFIPEIILRVML